MDGQGQRQEGLFYSPGRGRAAGVGFRTKEAELAEEESALFCAFLLGNWQMVVTFKEMGNVDLGRGGIICRSKMRRTF